VCRCGSSRGLSALGWHTNGTLTAGSYYGAYIAGRKGYKSALSHTPEAFMRPPNLLLYGLMASGIALSACSPESPLSPIAQGPSFVISDGAHAGNSHFFFLPPMVRNPSFSGTFDGTRSPVVRISEDGSPLVDLTATIPAGSEQYQVDWHTDRFNLDPAKTYRITILVDGVVLGFADVDVVSTGGQLKNVNTGEYIPLLDGRTLPIKFRIENGAIPAGTPLSSLQLVYAERDNTTLSIYAMMGDGSGRRFVNVGTGPTWVDNNILARGAWQDNAIYAMDSTGGNRHTIVGPGPSYAPDFSPDGQKFTFLYGDCGGGHPIATAHADGSGLAVLPICTSGIPRWSPLGNRIAYPVGGTIYTAMADGSDIRAVTTVSGIVGGVVWSASATRLLFSYTPSGSAHGGIYRVNTDGTSQQQITDLAADDWVQDWSASGDWVLFFSTRSGSLDLWVMHSDGSGAVNLTPGRAPPDAVQWKK